MKSTYEMPIDTRLGIFLKAEGFSCRDEVTELRDKIQEKVKVQESKRLSRISSLLISAWQVVDILAKLSSGESLVIDGETGEIYRGRVKTENLRPTGMKLPSRVSHAVDTAEFTPEILKTTSFATPVILAKFKSSWDLALKRPENKESPVVEIFLEKLVETSLDDISYNAVHMPHGTMYTEISIKNWPVKVAFSKAGYARYYIHNGKKTEL